MKLAFYLKIELSVRAYFGSTFTRSFASQGMDENAKVSSNGFLSPFSLSFPSLWWQTAQCIKQCGLDAGKGKLWSLGNMLSVDSFC